MSTIIFKNKLIRQYRKAARGLKILVIEVLLLSAGKFVYMFPRVWFLAKKGF